ncbi:MAG: dTMP kinase [Actinomycetaceae bacterium]|nr:dTMP kinase [Actinomycetaceae bacterium]
MRNDSSHGLFITFEGGDSCGKTTQIELIRQWLTSVGIDPVVTREPGGTPLGNKIRQLILHGPDDIDARCEALLYAADRAYHIATKVRPALADGRIVVQDRYLDSSVAYQGTARALGANEIRDLSLWATNNLLPDVTLLLDIDPAVARARRTRELDRLEREPLEFHSRIREQYLALADANSDRFHVIDASATPDQIHTRVKAILDPLVRPYLSDLKRED